MNNELIINENGEIISESGIKTNLAFGASMPNLIPDFLETFESQDSRRTSTTNLKAIAFSIIKGNADNDQYNNTVTNKAKKFANVDITSFPWHLIQASDIYKVKNNFLAEGLAPSTINNRLSTMRSLAQYMFTEGIIKVEAFERLRLVKNSKAKKVRDKKELKTQQVKEFIKACDDCTHMGLRDLSIFFLMIGCGLRRSEVVKILLKDVNLDERKILIKGKGNKERIVWLSDDVLEPLLEYLSEVLHEPKEDQHLYLPFDHHDNPIYSKVKNRGKPNESVVCGMAPSAINYLLNERGQLKNVDKFKPHDLRGTYATRQLRNKVDIKTVANLLGHASILTTQIYDLRGEEEAREAGLNYKVI